MKDRNKVVKILNSWLDAKKGSTTHKHIIDVYNTIKGVPKMNYTAAWCAATASAAFKEAGYEDIFPCECSCGQIIEKAKKMGIWQEKDTYTPKLADAIIYAWKDDKKTYATTDNITGHDHIGVVTSVNGNKFIVAEGNKGTPSKVGLRTMNVNGRYIRGFITPKFDETGKKSDNDIALEVINGSWGTGVERKKRLSEAGYDPSAIQKIVNSLLK